MKTAAPATFPPGPSERPDDQLTQYLADPFGHVERMCAEHGRIFTLHLGTLGNGERDGVDANGRWVFLTRPEQVRAMYEAPTRVVSGGQANRVFFGTDEDSVGFVDGDVHRCRRARLQPGLSGSRDHTALVEQVTTSHLRRWPGEEPFPLYLALQRLTAEVIVTVVCGGLDLADRKLLAAVLPRTENAELGADAAAAAEQEIKALVGARLAGHLERCDRGGGDDLMAELLRPAGDGRDLSPGTVRDEVFSLLYTGFSTTANTLSWVLVELLGDPRVEHEARTEVAAGFVPGMGHRAAAAALPYLDAVVNEALRLHPVSALNGVRLATAPVAVDDYVVPAGTVLVHCAHLVQRSPDLFDEPHRFRPERFLDEPVGPYAFAPFGGGARTCVGRVFALRELRAMLATILSQLVLEPATVRPAARQEGIFMAPEDRALCRATLVSPPAAARGES